MAYKVRGAKPRNITVSGTSVYADGIEVPYSALKRQELISAVSQRFGLGGPQLMYLQNGDLMTALVTDTAPIDSRGEPATDKQIWKLNELGYGRASIHWTGKDAKDLTKREASGIISAMVDTPKPAARIETWEQEEAPKAEAKPPVEIDLSAYLTKSEHVYDYGILSGQIESLSLAIERVESSKPKIVSITNRPTVKIEKQTHETFERVLLLTVAGNNGGLWPLLVGPAGTGKSTIASDVAKALSVPFYPFSCGPTKTETALTGYMNANGIYVATDFRKAYEHGGMFCVDEIDASHPGVMTSLNNALANREMMFPDGMVNRHKDFYCIGTANTFGTGATRQYVGRNQLDAATLDRFSTKEIGYDVSLERSIASAIDPVNAEEILSSVWKVRKAVEQEGVHMIVGTRAIVGTAHLTALGSDLDEALEECMWKGTPVDVRRKVSA